MIVNINMFIKPTQKVFDIVSCVFTYLDEKEVLTYCYITI